MKSNDKLKEIDIKNCASYYFNGVVEFEDFDIDNILISYENVLVFNNWYKNLIAAKPLRVSFL